MDINIARSEMHDISVQEVRKHLTLGLEEGDIDLHPHLTPISSVPVEVLAKIFLECAHGPWFTAPQYAYIHKKGSEWTAVSHVCRHWRAVALGCPGLWSLLNPSMSAKWLKVMVERSKDLPISIVDFYPYHIESKKREVLLTVLSEPSRWRHIHVCLTHDVSDLFKLISGIISPAPSLVNFHLTVQASRFDQVRKVLPREFLGESAQSLRHFEVVNCEPSWNSKMFSNNLTSLRLSNPPLSSTRRGKSRLEPSPDDLAEFLARIPNLTELELEMKFPDISTLKPSGRTLSFPLLQKLRLIGECGELAGLLDCLRLPSTTCIVIECALASEATLLALGRALEKAWTTRPVVSRLRLWHQGAALYTESDGNDLSSASGIPLFISMARISGWGQGLKRVTFPGACQLLGVVLWDNVETVDVTYPFELGAEDTEWRTIFERMKKVKNLTVFSEAARDTVNALTHTTKQPSSQPGVESTSVVDVVPLPLLETLTICGANILLTSKGLSSYGPDTRATIVTFQDIVQWLQQRRMLGVPKLKQLLVKNCSGFSSKVQELFQKLEKAGLTEEMKQEGCMAEVKDLDRGSDSEETENGYHEGYGHHNNLYLSDDGFCSGCLDFECGGECEDSY